MLPDTARRKIAAKTRRTFLKGIGAATTTGVVGSLAGCTSQVSYPTGLVSEGAVHPFSLASEGSLTVTDVEPIYVNMPQRPLAAKHNIRRLPGRGLHTLARVELESGHVGYGDQFAIRDVPVDRAVGENAASLMWDDSIGEALQVALFDAVGRAVDVPIHELLGTKVYDETPISWWAIDMPGEDWLSFCETAIDHGVTHMKLKGRPWNDLPGHITYLSENLPADFKIGIDPEETLGRPDAPPRLSEERAISILEQIDQFPQVQTIEDPLFVGDIDGSLAIQDAIETPLATHYLPHLGLEQLSGEQADLWSAFVVYGNASQLMTVGRTMEQAGKSFWLQILGTGIKAAYSAHFGGVLEQATEAAVNTNFQFTHSLLEDDDGNPMSLPVSDGMTPVPDEPGLGYNVDEDQIEQFRIEKPDYVLPNPQRLIEVSYESESVLQNVQKVYYTSGGQMIMYGEHVDMPYYKRGTFARTIPNDGSEFTPTEWENLWERANHEPVVVGGPWLPPELKIDVQPQRDTARINLKNGRGTVKVAVLAAHLSDAQLFDPTSERVAYRFGPRSVVNDGGGAHPIHDGHVRDVNGDGMDDLVLHFRVDETGFTGEENEGVLAWTSHDGPYRGLVRARLTQRRPLTQRDHHGLHGSDEVTFND